MMMIIGLNRRVCEKNGRAIIGEKRIWTEKQEEKKWRKTRESEKKT